MPVLDDLRAELAELERLGLRRHPHVLDAVSGVEARIDGRPVVLFCSNDYLGLSDDPRLVAACRDALDRFGVGAGASRLISGTRPPHRAAEERLAAFVGLPAALLFSTGYAANMGALSTVLARGDVAFSDRLNHASLIDGLRLSRATVHVYDHADPEHLEVLLRKHRSEGRRAWVVTDAVFSMDGDRAPLAALRQLSRQHDAGLFVDEAHALGTLGDGRGLCRQLGIEPDVLVGTLGKAVGVAGAFAAGPPELRALLESRARSYVFSTAPPPVLAATIEAAVDVVERGADARARLDAHTRRLHAALQAQGWHVPSDGSTPILPVVIGEPAKTMALSAELLARGFFVQGIRPPTVPPGTSRLRIVPTAAHTAEHVEALVAAFADVRGLG